MKRWIFSHMPSWLGTQNLPLHFEKLALPLSMSAGHETSSGRDDCFHETEKVLGSFVLCFHITGLKYTKTDLREHDNDERPRVFVSLLVDDDSYKTAFRAYLLPRSWTKYSS